MLSELPKQYDPAAIEHHVYERWLAADAFAAVPDDNPRRFVVMMPLPNVTGALHMGHAMDNVMQDLLVRWHRMRGDNTLWMPGTDHAGIGTQAVVEKRLFELEGKTRHDVGREGLVRRIWDWKEVCQKRIISQQQAMGCSCDWGRQRFTMDKVCERAVRWTFFNLFRDGLIYRGNRMVNWDCHLETAVADDELFHAAVKGHFWYLRYPLIDPRPGEPDGVVVATTRPETMLGDTAVACHPDPRGALDAAIADARRRLAAAAPRDRDALEAEVLRVEERRTTHLPRLEQLAAMARRGARVRLPLLGRSIPLVLDVWAKPELGTGCVKITPAHDPNDYDVWRRHTAEFDAINILNSNGTLNSAAGPYAGLDRFVARGRVVDDLTAAGLVEAVEDRDIEIGHSDRSDTPIEPLLSRQWFVRMGDVEGGVLCGRGTGKEFAARGLAQAAIDAVGSGWRSASGRSLTFHPDSERYAGTFLSWLAEKRDWCISRQLWWGHRIPIWSSSAPDAAAALADLLGRGDVSARRMLPDGTSTLLGAGPAHAALGERHGAADGAEVLVCLRDATVQAELGGLLESRGFVQDPDVLDTWFSSGVWPHSTLGWPDPGTAEVDAGQRPLGAAVGRADALSCYYPGSCLVTGRDIITLWVVRMTFLGLYNLGDIPFTDVFIHANILDGKGVRMSKSKGNGVDPVDIIERYGADAMRYVIAEIQTGMQDIRLPVQAISPYTGGHIDLATARHGKSMFTYICPESGKEFDVLGTMPGVPAAKLVSDRFEVGRNFLNKLLNAGRFALMNLEGAAFAPRRLEDLELEDRWVLSRIERAAREVHRQLEAYNPAAALAAARDVFWSDLCDWYLELIKPRTRDPERAPLARQILAAAFDQVLRLLHPFVPHLTEALWERLNAMAPCRGVGEQLPPSPLLIHAAWPQADQGWSAPELEDNVACFQEVTRAVRDIRAKHSIHSSVRLSVGVRARGESGRALVAFKTLLSHLVGIGDIEVSPETQRSADAAVAVISGGVEVYVAGVVDLGKERARLENQLAELGGRVDGVRRKLENQDFLRKAKPEVVERERARLEALRGELSGVEANLRALGH